jgi:hypothetical protein
MAGIFSHFTGKSAIYFPGAAFITAAFLMFCALIIAWFTIKSKKFSS